MHVECGPAVGGCEALDVLIVIDNSGSIHPETQDILLPRFGASFLGSELGELLQNTCRYHVGVTSTEPRLDPEAPLNCQVRGALNRRAIGESGIDCFGGAESHPQPYLRAPDTPKSLPCISALGWDYEPDEHQVETMFAALSGPMNGPGGCNEGFLQPDSKLIVVLITDEDDDDDSYTEPGRTGSPGNMDTWLRDLEAHRALSDIAFVLLAPIDPQTVDAPTCGAFEPIVDDPLPDNHDGVGSEYAERLQKFWVRTQTRGALGLQIDLCVPDAVTELSARIVDVARELCRAP